MWRGQSSTDDYARPFDPSVSGFFPPECHPQGAGRDHKRPDPALPCGFGWLAEGRDSNPRWTEMAHNGFRDRSYDDKRPANWNTANPEGNAEGKKVIANPGGARCHRTTWLAAT